jgi:hypothetical protein
MTRFSDDELRDGRIFNGFDYRIQVWVVDGVIPPCGHPASLRHGGVLCCNAHRYAGQRIAEVPGAESFPHQMTRRASA